MKSPNTKKKSLVGLLRRVDGSQACTVPSAWLQEPESRCAIHVALCGLASRRQRSMRDKYFQTIARDAAVSSLHPSMAGVTFAQSQPQHLVCGIPFVTQVLWLDE
jgi:hypothetical protein